MKGCVNKSLSLAIVMLVGIYGLFWGCGKKGPPVPPRREKPPAVEDLSHRLDGSRLELSWSVPRKDSSQQPDLTGFKVYVSKTPMAEAECENCPLKFKAIADLPIGEKGEQNQLKFSEILESGYRYVYMVRGFSEDGMISEDSNYVYVIVE